MGVEISSLEQVQDAANASFNTKLKGLREQGYTEAQILKLRNAEISKVTKDFNDKQKTEADKLAADTKASKEKFIEAELSATQKQYLQQINFIKLRDANLVDQSKTNQEIADIELKSLESQLATKKKFGEDTTAIEQQILDKKRGIREQDLAEEKAKAEKEKAIQTAKFQAVNDSLTAIADIYSAFAGQSEEDQKKAFEVNKAAQISQAIINTYQAVNAALTAGGNPAKVIRQRFDDQAIANLLKIAWWNWDMEKITRNLDRIVSADIKALQNCT